MRPDGAIAWARPVDEGDSVTSTIALGEDAVYYGTYHGVVVALNLDGTLRWKVPLTTSIVHSLTRGDDGTLYAMLDGALVALGAGGRTVWEQQLGRGLSPPPAIGADGTRYVGGDGLRAFRRDGVRAWQVALKGLVRTPVIARDGTLFVAAPNFGGSDIGRVYAIGPGGDVLWTYYLDPPTSMTLAADKLLYVVTQRRVYAIGECTKDSCEDDGSALPARYGPPPEPARPTIAIPPKPIPATREPYDGYTVYPGCRPNTTAIVSSTGVEPGWVSADRETAKISAEREEFRTRAIGAAGLNPYATGFGASCVERAAFVMAIAPGQDVATAARRVGQWLVDADVRAEIDIVVSTPPRLF